MHLHPVLASLSSQLAVKLCQRSQRHRHSLQRQGVDRSHGVQHGHQRWRQRSMGQFCMLDVTAREARHDSVHAQDGRYGNHGPRASGTAN